MVTIVEEKIMSLKRHYQNIEISEDGAVVVVTLTDAKFTSASPALSILLPNTTDFEIRALQKGVVELRLFFERQILNSVVAGTD